MNEPLIQFIEQPPQQGKTDMLIALANGYANQGKKVVFVLPTSEMVYHFKKRKGKKLVRIVDCVGCVELFDKPLNIRVDCPDVFIFDDFDRCQTQEGVPIELIKSLYMMRTEPYVIICAINMILDKKPEWKRVNEIIDRNDKVDALYKDFLKKPSESVCTANHYKISTFEQIAILGGMVTTISVCVGAAVMAMGGCTI